eukprot:2339046-Pleurochrysis_carterae.AAC.1
MSRLRPIVTGGTTCGKHQYNNHCVYSDQRFPQVRDVTYWPNSLSLNMALWQRTRSSIGMANKIRMPSYMCFHGG